MVKASGSAASSKQKQKLNEEEELLLQKRQKLKKLAFSNNILSDTPSTSSPPLAPSKTVIKHHGRDILRKSQRKNKFLFSLPGLLAPLSGGKIGDLKDLASKNPVLYLDFPQGQMKLFGTIVYPKNRYLTLQFSKSGKNVMCEDSFDNMIVFSDAWWIGKKEENPEEKRLDFPKELIEEQDIDECDFKGGAGGEASERTTGKRKIQICSREDSAGSGAQITKEEEEEEKEKEKVEGEEEEKKEASKDNPGSPVKASISALFQKWQEKKAVEEKKAPRNSRRSASSEVSGQILQQSSSKRKISQAADPRKRGKTIDEKKSGAGTKAKRKVQEVEDDDIEEISSSSEDNEGSDEDWAA